MSRFWKVSWINISFYIFYLNNCIIYFLLILCAVETGLAWGPYDRPTAPDPVSLLGTWVGNGAPPSSELLMGLVASQKLTPAAGHEEQFWEELVVHSAPKCISNSRKTQATFQGGVWTGLTRFGSTSDSRTMKYSARSTRHCRCKRATAVVGRRELVLETHAWWILGVYTHQDPENWYFLRLVNSSGMPVLADFCMIGTCWYTDQYKKKYSCTLVQLYFTFCITQYQYKVTKKSWHYYLKQKYKKKYWSS